MTEFYWVGGTGDLGVASNWRTYDSDGALTVATAPPGSADIAEIDLAGTLLGVLAAQQLNIDAAASIDATTNVGSNAIIGNSAAGGVTVNGGSWTETGALTIGNAVAGMLSISGGGVVDVGQQINVGETAGGAGTLIVTSGTFNIAGSYSELGNLAGAQGTATIDGSGARWNIANGGELAVGNYGTGDLLIAAGGVVQFAGGPSNVAYSDLIIGFEQGSVGTLTVDNATLDTGLGDLGVGLDGVGRLLIENGGTVLTSGAAYGADGEAFYIGYSANGSATGSGIVTIDGPGSVLKAAGVIDIGDSEAGLLTVSNGATVEYTGTGEPDGASNVIVGFSASAAGTIDVTGSGALFDAGPGRLGVGRYGEGTLTVSQGATVLASNTEYTDTEDAFVAGISVGSVGVVTVDGAGSLIKTQGSVVVGREGSGTLSISNQGTVDATATEQVAFLVGYGPGSVGMVTIDGAGSTLSAAGQAVIGQYGDGTVVISNGGQMSAGGTNDGGTGLILNANGGHGDVQVSGGTLLVSDSAQVNANALLTAANGATVGIGGNLTLGAGSELSADNTSRIEIGGRGTVAAGTIAVDAGHTLAGDGTIGGVLANSGVVDVRAGTMAVLGSISGTGAVTVENGATLETDAAVGAGQNITLDVGSTLHVLPAGSSTSQTFAFLGTLDLSAGDETIAVDALVTADGVSVINGNALAFDVSLNGTNTPETIALSGLASGVTPTISGSDIIIPCFASGTRIATKDGDKPVEQLAVGDTVLARSLGPTSIVWLGHRHVDCRRHPRPRDVWPIRIRAGAFRRGVPRRDLVVSPDHAVFINGVLVPVRYLVNGATIVQEPCDHVTYWHVELAQHDLLLAEGLPCESYLDTGNRAAFANGDGTVMLHPDFAWHAWSTRACAPLVLDGPECTAARHRLLARAKRLGHAVTDDADIRLLADGVLVRSSVQAGSVHRFKVGSRVKELRILSRSGVPAELHADGTDHRRLGVMIEGIAFFSPFRWHGLGLTDVPMGCGFHRLEEEDGRSWRWTDGDALLPIPAECTRDGILYVELLIGVNGSYWLPAPAATASASRLAPRKHGRS